MGRSDDGYAFAMATIWMGGYALASIIFSFAETQPAIAISLIVMMISCMRFPVCMDAYDVYSEFDITEPTVIAAYVICIIGIITATIRAVSFL